MTSAFSVQSLTVNSGTVITSPANIKDADNVAVYMPLLGVATTLAVEASFDTTSANFFPLTAVNSQGLFAAPVGSGNTGVNLTALVAGFPFIRLKLANAVTAPVTFQLFTRR